MARDYGNGKRKNSREKGLRTRDYGNEKGKRRMIGKWAGHKDRSTIPSGTNFRIISWQVILKQLTYFLKIF